MAKITAKPTITVEATFTLSEVEMEAIAALSAYGADSFIKIYSEHLGNVLKPHEDGLRSFLGIGSDINRLLHRAKVAREAFKAA